MIYASCHLVSGLLLMKVPGHVVGQGAGAFGILWLVSRSPILFFSRKNIISITVEYDDSKESLNSLSHNTFSS